MDKQTKVCVSIASNPGTFGVNFHNKGYQELKLNYVYVPLKVLPEQLSTVIDLVKFNAHGCSVSMPHKEAVLSLLDDIEPHAKKIGAVNTIVNNGGLLKGYNTDYEGCKKAISSITKIKDKRVVLVGAGGVAKAIAAAVTDLDGRLMIVNRTDSKARKLAKEWKAEYSPWSKLEGLSGHLLINTTPGGMNDTNECLLPTSIVKNFDVIMDTVIADTLLLQKATSEGKKTIPGKLMTVYQAAAQFSLYTSKKLPPHFIKEMLLI